MNKRNEKILVIIIITGSLVFTGGQFLTKPADLNAVGESSIPSYSIYSLEKPQGLNLGISRDNATFFFLVNAKLSPWISNDPLVLGISVLKSLPHTSFPYTSLSLSLSNVTLAVNGTQQEITFYHKDMNSNDSMITYSYLVNPIRMYSGNFSISVSFTVNPTYEIGPYHYSGNPVPIQETIMVHP